MIERKACISIGVDQEYYYRSKMQTLKQKKEKIIKAIKCCSDYITEEIAEEIFLDISVTLLLSPSTNVTICKDSSGGSMEVCHIIEMFKNIDQDGVSFGILINERTQSFVRVRPENKVDLSIPF